MKKSFLFLMSALLVTSFTACSANNAENSETEHTHEATGSWEANPTEHWHVCECGEELDKAVHTFDDFDKCTICRSIITDWGDGTYGVNILNENGDTIHSKNYDESGNITDECFSEYKTDSDGNSYEYRATYLTSDGTKSVTEYDENANFITSVSYDSNGTKTSETIYTYDIDSDGYSYESMCTDYDYASGIVTVTEYNEYGDETLVTESNLDGTNKTVTRFEFEYNEEGKHLYLKRYENDVLIYEITGYKTYETDEIYMRFPEKVIDYYDDGAKLVTVYNDTGDIDSETYFDEAGGVDYELIYSYETFEDGNYKNIKTHKNGKLISEKEYIYDEEFSMSYMSKEIEYDENGTVISVNEYDSDGMEIE